MQPLGTADPESGAPLAVVDVAGTVDALPETGLSTRSRLGAEAYGMNRCLPLWIEFSAIGPDRPLGARLTGGRYGRGATPAEVVGEWPWRQVEPSVSPSVGSAWRVLGNVSVTDIATYE